MNYLLEIVSFGEWKEVNPLPAGAIALWHELMAVWNKAGWIREFTVSNGLLQSRAGLSRKEFIHARQVLIQSGRIVYRKSERVNQAGKYQIIPFVQKGTQKGTHEGTQKGTLEEHGRGRERGPLDLDLNRSSLAVTDLDLNRSSLAFKKTKTKLKKERRETPPPSPVKNKYLDYVELTEPEFKALQSTYGEAKTAEYMERLNDYIGQIGAARAKKKYSSHYHVIRNWARRDNVPIRAALKNPEYPGGPNCKCKGTGVIVIEEPAPGSPVPNRTYIKCPHLEDDKT